MPKRPGPISESHRQFIDSRLEQYGLFGFHEFNRFVKCSLLNTSNVLGGTSPAGRYVRDLLESGDYKRVPLPMGEMDGQVRHGGRLLTHVVEKSLVPYVAEARLSNKASYLGKPPLVHILGQIEAQLEAGAKRRVTLHAALTGVRMLEKEGLLERVRFSPGRRPENLPHGHLKFMITDPKLMRRVITAVKRATELQRKIHG